jgi:segregation and condensation protein A
VTQTKASAKAKGPPPAGGRPETAEGPLEAKRLPISVGEARDVVGATNARNARNAGNAGNAGNVGVAPSFEGQYRVDLPEAGFEGPLDLLLHLIQQHELDILDIPIGFVTERFLRYLAVMRTLTIDIASEYLVMAATLAHIKSKMLLPTVPEGQDDALPGEEEEDPREELVRRLLEYQKYKAAASELAERGTLGKDVFGRGSGEPVPQGPAPFAQPGVFSLLDAFEKVLSRTNVKLDHEVVFDRISITDRMMELSEKLLARRTMRFDEMLLDAGRTPTRFDVVITFLAVLEMAKLRMVRVYQSDPLAPIHIEVALVDGTDRVGGADEGAVASGEERP